MIILWDIMYPENYSAIFYGSFKIFFLDWDHSNGAKVSEIDFMAQKMGGKV